MAVNLRAVATLNNKPFLKSLNEISAATERLNSVSILGSTKGNDPLKDKISSIKRASDAATVAADGAVSNARKVATGFSTINRSAAEYDDGLKNISAASDQAIKRMGTMTQKQIALENSSRALRDARRNLADVMSVDRVDGDPVVERAEKQLRAAETAQARNLRAIRAEELAVTKKIAAEEALADAHDKGERSAKKYRNTVAGLNAEQLRSRQLTNNLAIAEGNLARQLAVSGGLRSPAVLAAENRLMSAQGAIQAQNAAGMSAATGSMTAQRHALRDLSRQFAMTALGMAAFPALAIGFSAAWESSFSNVVRTADPAFSNVESKVQGLRNSLVSLTQSMPVSFGKVTEIATLANQMGIASGQVADFTRAVAMFSATSGVSVDVSATAFGRLTSILGNNRLGFMEMADSILKVGVNSVATEDEIINVTTQISSIAAQAGFAGKDIIGLSGALASVRVPPELSRGLVTRVFGQIDKAVAGSGSQLATLARVSGMSVDEFKEGWGTNGAAGIFNKFLQGLQKGGAAARGELEALGITSVRDVPVLLRLANAADSDGVVGGLLTQTLIDANNAAGETQRQYSIMADTVVSKLKVLGNNIAAFFDAVGQTGLGVFGDVLDNLTKGIRDFTRDLDKPMKILGAFELPFTNSEALGAMMTLGIAATGLTLAAAAAAKLGSAFLNVKQASTWIASLGVTRSLVGTMGATFGTAAAGATTFAGGMAGATGAVGKFAGTAGRLISFMGGPWILGLTAAVGIIAALTNSSNDAKTNVDDFTESLASVNLGSLNNVNALLGSITAGTPEHWFDTDGTKVFANGVDDIVNRLAIMKETFSTYDGLFSWSNLATDWFMGFGKFDKTFSEGFGIMDESIGKLVDSGNSAKAAQLLMTLGKAGADLPTMLKLDEMGNTSAFLKNAFDLSGLEMTDANLRKFANGTLPQVTDSMFGFAGATRVAMDLFDGDVEAVGAFTEALTTATASFIDFGAAAEAAFDGENFDLSKYIKAMQEQLTNQANWSANMATVADYVSAPLLQALASDTSEAGKAAMAALAEGLRNGSPEAIEAINQLETNLAAQVRDGSDTEIKMAFRQWASALLGDEGLGRELANALDQTQFSQLQSAAEGVGKDVVANVLKGIQSGEISFEEGMKLLKLEVPLQVAEKLDTKSADRASKALQNTLLSKFGDGVSVPMKLDVLSSTSTIGDLKALVNDPELNSLKISPEISLTEAYAQSREFQVWAEAQGIDFLLGADDSAARMSVALLVALANGSVGEITLNALPALAVGAIWEVVTLANGETGFIQIDANNQLAMNSVWAVDAATGVPMEIPIDADNLAAINKILEVRGNASASPANLDVVAIDKASGAIDYIARSRTATITVQSVEVPFKPKAIWERAYGGITEAYAKGGVREDHRPQIAPAGAMRLWAEPETGGEAYIPFAMDRRKRAEGILNEVASRFGYSLVRGNNVSQYANGGMYELQSRSRSQRSIATRDSASSRGVSIGEVTFTDSTQKDQFREFTRTLNRVARGNR